MTWLVIFEAATQAEIAQAFPYALHFELLSEQRVSVLACLQHQRSPAPWPGN